MNKVLRDACEEWKLAEYLAKRVCDHASGRNESECLRNYPRDVYFVGNLRPALPDLPDATPYLSELKTKLAPSAFGAEFRLSPRGESAAIEIMLQWACYYRVFPTWEQQCEHQISQAAETGSESTNTESANTDSSNAETEAAQTSGESNSGDDYTVEVEREREADRAEAESPEVTESLNDRRQVRRARDSLFIRFRKIPCTASGRIILRRDSTAIWAIDTTDLQAALDRELARASQVVLNDPEHLRTSGDPIEKIRVPETTLASAEDYQHFLRSLCTDVIPTWRWEVRVELPLESANEFVVLLEFVNTSPMPEQAPNTEAFLFDTQARFSFTGTEILPFELDLAPKGFRYERRLWGRGFNCAVEQRDTDTTIFETIHTPIYRQMRYTTRTEPSARFDDLVRAPLPTLEAILNAMESYRQVWIQKREAYVATDPAWGANHGSQFDKDQRQFEEEIARFRRGLELVRDDPDVRFALQLTNETFRRAGAHPLPEKRKESWRLFQIIFLVTQIPGIAALASGNSSDAVDREAVDIIYFPTGGGKTEAYLATLVFNCFFDRLRGKAAGVTAWTRFPLRLLTLQQTQRMADIIGMAELVRRKQTDQRLSGRGVAGFAVGYFVGQGGSPNELVNPERYRYARPEDQLNWSLANDPQDRQRWQRVIRCPACRTSSVRVDFDPTSVRVIHRCTEPGCNFPDGVIPVYIVDNEIYRYLPAVIVGTIDKLASLGNQRKLAQIFGEVDGWCTVHGYYKGKCCQKDCSDPTRLRAQRPHGLSGPTLFIQDELHLLKEGLGTFDSHYETFVQRLQREFGTNLPLKVIASSATIEAFERQVEHLYGREARQARVFPGLGPTLAQSFYAETQDYPQRLFIGLIPHNKTILNTILELIERYHREVQSLQRLAPGAANPYGGALTSGSEAWRKLLDLYSTSLTYFLAGRELDSIHTDINGDVNSNLERDGLMSLDIHELTGGTGTDEVTRVLEHLERSAETDPVADAVLATSMVSHGVDVDRLNAMIFYGMPRQTAEYIQASSRVGRSHVGVIFTCLHPVRERDRSHFAYFAKYHEFLGQLVEPVAINRWSQFSIHRTLPGLFMAVLLQLISNRSEGNPNRFYMLDFVKQQIAQGNLRPDSFIPLLQQAYLVDSTSSVASQHFRDTINAGVQRFWDQINSASPSSQFVSEALIPKPMRSLRDVDEPIVIELDSTGSTWASGSTKQ